jgi:hypothetical protein
MDQKYRDLLKEVAQSASVAAEQVMDYDKAKNDEKGFEVAKQLRDDYNVLINKLGTDEILTRGDYLKLYAGALIVANNLRDRRTILDKAINGYDNDLLPKLKSLVDDTTSDDEANAQADKVFIIEEN